MKLRKITLILLSVLLFAPLACEEGLDVTNPNNPTPDIVENEEGLKRLARGLYSTGWFLGTNGGAIEWLALQWHEHMGDNLVAPWVNWSFARTHLNVERIEFSDGTVVTPAASSADGRTQPEWINFINSREDPRGGVEIEWTSMYRLNNESNLILQTLNSESGVEFSGDAQAKERGFRAWAHFWKGFAYSRIGNFYELGIIVDEYGETNNDYKLPSEMLEESNRQLEMALQYVSNGIGAVIGDIQPGFFPTNITEASFAQNIHTLIARNKLNVKKRNELTQAEWQEIKDIAENGLMNNDGAVLVASDNATHLNTVTVKWRLAAGWSRASTRVVQAARHNDDARGASFLDATRGPFGSALFHNLNAPHGAVAPYGTTEEFAPIYLISAEENLLILAEAELALGNPGAAASYIDQARQLQQANLDPLGSATLEDLRRERRIGLFLRAQAFYDARRFDELQNCVEGLWVWRQLEDGSIELDENATICYGFLEYIPVPDRETTFNPIPADVMPTSSMQSAPGLN